MSRLLTLAALLVAVPAWAGLPVTYDTDYKTLKKEVAIGDPLSFELFEVADCSGTPAYSEILGAGTPEVAVEVVRSVGAKGERPRPPKIARLRATVGVPEVAAPLYLHVHGSGILPVGSACQAQVVAAVGPRGPQGPPGPSFSVFDASGTEIGALVSLIYGTDFLVYLESIGAMAYLVQDEEEIQLSGDPVFFSQPNCQGQAHLDYVFAGRLTGPRDPSGRLFVGRRAPWAEVNYGSRLMDSGCQNNLSGTETNLVPTDEVSFGDLGLTYPLPLPLHIAPDTP